MDPKQRKRLVNAIPGALESLKQTGLAEDAQRDPRSGTITITLDPVTFGEPAERRVAKDMAANAISRARRPKD